MARQMFSAGTVSVDVVPDTSGFMAKLDALLERAANKNVDVTANLDWDDGAASAKYREWNNRVAEIQIKADDSNARRLVDKWDGRNVNAQLSLDTKKFQRELDGVQRDLKKVNVQVGMQKRWKKNEDALKSYMTLQQQQERLTRRQTTLIKDELNNRLQAVRSMQDALLKANPLGDSSSMFTREAANKVVARYKSLLKQVESDPLKVRMQMDDVDYRSVVARLEAITRQKTKTAEENSRVKLYLDGAERIEKRLDALRHSRLRIPAEIEVEQTDLAKRLREAAEKVRLNPDAKYELNIDADMKRAEERVKKFRNDNDSFDMDVDLETAAATAHLAYFTRPRTIDVFASFKGTDLGKILNGMTSGATGIRGVQNEWRKLVTMFDSFDKVVPKWSLIGAAATSVGAGLLNLGRTAGSVGASLVSMSSAALAAPAALSGLAAGFYTAYSAVKTFGDHVDVAKTKFNDLQKSVGGSFWNSGAAASMTRMLNVLGDSGVVDNLNEIADAEGKVFAHAADIVAQGDYVQRVNKVLSNTRLGVQSLNPGVESLTKAFITLGDQTSVYLPRMANYVSRNATVFAQWVESAEQSGRITSNMEKAVEQGGYLMSSVKSLGGILKGTFGTLAEGENGLEKFSDAMGRADRAVNGVKFQATLTAWADGAKQASGKFHDSFAQIGDAAYSLRDTTRQVFVDAGTIVSSGIGSVSSVLKQSESGISAFSKGVTSGFTQVFAAVRNAGPMFNSLTSMVGQLSSTFGGTLANTLNAAAPTIQVLAEGASAVAKAFGKLPAPIQAVIGMYATFGKAGISAYNSLKQGMLQNIQSTLQYRKIMSQLGITSKEASASMSELVRAMARLKSGQTAGVLTGEVSGIRQMGAAADETTSKLNRMHAAQSGGSTGVSSGSTGSVSAMRGVGVAAESAARKTGLLKTALSGVVDFLGGPLGIAIGAASTAFGVAGSAISTYNNSASHTQSVNQTVAKSFKEVSGNADSAAKAVSDAKKNIKKNWTDTSYGWSDDSSNAAEKALNGFQQWTSPFKNASKAADALGVSVKKLNSAATGSNSTYDKMHDKLTKLANDHKYMIGAYGQTIDVNQQQTEAASRLLGVLENSRKEWQSGAKAIKSYANSSQIVSDLNQSASDKLTLLSSSLAANGYELDKNTENSRANMSMMKDYAASTLIASKNTMSYYESIGKASEGQQLAKNSIYQARQEIMQMAEQCGLSADKAAELADQMGLIPENVSTKFDLSNLDSVKAQVQDYIDMLPLTEGEKKLILKYAAEGDITSFEQLQAAVRAVMGGADEKDLRLLLEAQDNASSKIKDAEGLAKSFGLTKADIKILATDEAGPKLDKVKAKLKDSGLTDAQIKILIDALDKASDKMDKTNSKKKQTEKGVKFNIDAEDGDASVKLAKYQGLNGVTLATARTFVVGDDSSAQSAFNNTRMYDGVTLAQPWGRVLGDNSIARVAFAAIQAFNGATISRPWGRVLGDNSSARKAFMDTRAYDGATISRPWGRVLGDASNANSVFNSIKNLDGSILATRYVDIVTRQSGDGSAKAATGGRIYGPGTGTSDSIPTMLSNGEAVIRAASLRKLDAKYGRGFFDTLNATGDVPAGSRIARASNTALAYRDHSRKLGYASGGRVAGSGLDVNVTVSQDNSDLVAAVNELRGEVRSFHANIGSEIAANSSPWPSKRDFARDVWEVNNGR